MTERRDDLSTPALEIGAATRAKGHVNKDAFLIDEAHLLFGVFDGLGATSEAARSASVRAS
jgi:hypothetical protein